VTPVAHADGTAPGWWSAGDLAELAASWVAALGELEDVARGREAIVETKTGGSYRYRYADLGDVLSQARTVLARHGLAVFQVAQVVGEDVNVATTVMHTSGAHLTFAPFVLPAGTTVQATGSSITYGRRYALMSILGLATDDDDGATAGTRSAATAPAVLHPATVEQFLQRARAAELSDDAIADVVATATGGRTTIAGNVHAVELDALRAALDAAVSPVGDVADATVAADDAADDARPASGTALVATRAQLATLGSLRRRNGLGLDGRDVERGVIGRDVEDSQLSRHEADQLIAAHQGVVDGSMSLLWHDDGTVTLTARTDTPAAISSATESEPS
jgi:hypothetical protein